jgi:hypothetical protein
MRELLLRRRLVGATAALSVAGMVFAPAATSQGNPHGIPPGQAKGQTPATSSFVPPGQAKTLPSTGSVSSSTPAPFVPPGQAKTLPITSIVSARAPVVPPGQAKNAVSAVPGASNAGHGGSPAPAAKQTKHASPATPTVVPAPTVTPAVTGAPAGAPSPTPTSTGKPAGSTRHGPGARGVSAQRRSSSRARRRAALTARRSAAARAVARAAAPATIAAAAAGLTAGGSASAASHQSGPLFAQPTGHGRNTGPIFSSIGNLIPVPLPVPDWSKPIILALVLISALLGLRAWLTSRRAGRLESQRGRLASDLAALQPALIPEIPPNFGPLAVSVAYRPADGPAAGGDFYDVFQVGTGRVAVMVGDVSGHGRAALTRAAHMRYMLRTYVETGLDPRSALKLAGRVMGADEDALFATVAVAVYDANAATLTYATAGHPPPLLLGQAAHEPLSSCASPALGWGEPTGRRQTTVPFSKGARACFFSDGVTEVRIHDGLLLGRERLNEEVELSGSATELLERVQKQAQIIRDDMAACIIEARSGTAVSEHRIDEFEVAVRHLDGGQGDRFLAECGVPAEDAAATLAKARSIAAEAGASLIRVELTGHTALATAGGSEPVSLATPPNLSPIERSDTRLAAGRGRGAEGAVGRTTTVVNQPPLN